MSKSRHQTIVDRIVDLPSLPQVVTTLIVKLDDPNSSAKDIDGILGQDPSLVAKLLKLVNSSFYGLPNKVTSIAQAVAILGFTTVKSLTISASLFNVFDDSREIFSHRSFWTHSLAVAVLARYVARRHGENLPADQRMNGDTMFVVGLLHGLGKLILDQYAPSEFKVVLLRAQSKKLAFEEAELPILGDSHTALGYWLLKNWRMAEEIQMAVFYQNRVSETPPPQRAMAAALALAIYWARTCSLGSAGDFNAPTLAPDVLPVFGIKDSTIPETWQAGLIPELESARQIMSLLQD